MLCRVNKFANSFLRVSDCARYAYANCFLRTERKKKAHFLTRVFLRKPGTNTPTKGESVVFSVPSSLGVISLFRRLLDLVGILPAEEARKL